jgi:hypothetical protein
MTAPRRRRASAPSVILGGLLVIGGIGLLLAQFYGIDVRFDLARYGWPVYVILAGVALLLIGLISPGQPGMGLAVAGAIVTSIGLILSYQWATDHWASWAYAWALVAPTSVGAAMVAWGILHLRGRVVRDGLGALFVGGVLFLVFFGFFEGLIGIGGDRGLAPLGRTALPLALIVAGALIILARGWPRRRHEREQAYAGAAWPPPAPTADEARVGETGVDAGSAGDASLTAEDETAPR